MLSQDDIQAKIEQYQDHIEGLVDEIREAGRESAITETNYEIAYAQERLNARFGGDEGRAKLNVDTVNDVATTKTAELRREMLLARNNLSTLREALQASRTNLESMRTLAASHRNIV